MTGAEAGEPRIALGGPTRWADAPAWLARLALALAFALAVYGVHFATARGYIEPIGPAGSNWIDSNLYAAVADRVRAGEPYYAAASAELRAAGYPTRSMFNYRLPTLTWLFGALPSNTAARRLLLLLAAATLLTWAWTLRTRASVGGAVALVGLLFGILGWPALASAYLIHEVWAGIAIALSIGAAAAGWPAVAVAAGLGALAIRELALAYVALALLLALVQRRRGEAAAWAAGIGLFIAALVAHRVATSQVASGADGAHVGTWLQFGGWPFVLKTAFTNAWLVAMPQAVTALLLPLSLLGLAGWRGRLGVRVAGTVALYVAAYLVVGQSFNYMWGYLYCGLAFLGLPFAAAALRDLWRAATRAAPGQTMTAEPDSPAVRAG